MKLTSTPIGVYSNNMQIAQSENQIKNNKVAN